MKRLKKVSLLFGLLLFVGLLAVPRSQSAEAAPVGAAVNQFVASQSCQSNGQVQVRFAWSPSGYGNQWIDVSIQSNFAGWANAGPVGPLTNILDWGNLQPNTTYYSRISTWAGVWLTSDPIAFTTIICQGPFSAPTNPRSSDLNNGIRFRWDRGENNYWFCVDTATSRDDLTGFKGSFANHGCGTMAVSLDVPSSQLPCGQTVYWRVYAGGPFVGGHSPIASFTGDACTFSVPKDLKSTVNSGTSVKFEWTKGLDNAWSCVDVATSQADLLGFKGSYKYFGCGTTASMIEATGLECNTHYVWRVFAQGVTGSGHSAVATFDTPSCSFTPPSALKSSDIGKTTVTVAWTPGVDNLWFCVDMAKSVEDLRFFTGSWKNYGCGTTDKKIDITALACDTTYYWRVYARGTNVGGHSAEVTFKTDPC